MMGTENYKNMGWFFLIWVQICEILQFLETAVDSDLLIFFSWNFTVHESFFPQENELYFKFTKVFSAKFVPKIGKHKNVFTKDSAKVFDSIRLLWFSWESNSEGSRGIQKPFELERNLVKVSSFKSFVLTLSLAFVPSCEWIPLQSLTLQNPLKNL